MEEAKGVDVSKTRRRWVTSSDFLDSDSANTTRLQLIYKDELVNQILVKQTPLTKGCFWWLVTKNLACEFIMFGDQADVSFSHWRVQMTWFVSSPWDLSLPITPVLSWLHLKMNEFIFNESGNQVMFKKALFLFTAFPFQSHQTYIFLPCTTSNATHTGNSTTSIKQCRSLWQLEWAFKACPDTMRTFVLTGYKCSKVSPTYG